MKARGFLAKHGLEAKVTVDAGAKLDRGQALLLASKASTVIVAKRGKVVRFSIKKERPTEGALLAHMLGPTGNLRAPTIVKGQTLLVGFDEGAYRELFARKRKKPG